MSNEWYDLDSWQWVDNNDYQWGFTSYSGIAYGGLKQIWADDLYVYAATTSGLDIIDILTESRIDFVFDAGGYTSVWTYENEIYIGTTANGISVLDRTIVGISQLQNYLNSYTTVPDILSNEIKYIHGNSNKLICCTMSSVEIIRRDTHYITHNSISGATKCFVTPLYDYYYYTISGSSSWDLCRLNGNSGDWTTPDVVYTTGSGFLTNATRINDFYATEHTSISGINNTLFVATDDGVYIYDEGSEELVIYRISK